jgi:hypothetical protein
MSGLPGYRCPVSGAVSRRVRHDDHRQTYSRGAGMIDFYRRLKEKEKNGRVIVCAIMRKLVHLIYGILKSGKPFDQNYKPNFA